MDHPQSTPPAGPARGSVWTPRPWRWPVFLGASALVALAVVLIAHAVMLPFVLAVVIAYVLTPLVAVVESRKIPRSLAVIVVYAMVIGSIGGFLRAVAPRIGLEFRNLRGELPAIANEARKTWVPVLTEQLRLAGLAPTVAPPVSSGQATPPDDTSESGPTSAFVARPQADGSIAIDVGAGVTISETKHGWIVESTRDKKDEPFDPNRIVSDVIGRTFAYAQNNSLEVARAVRDLVTGVGRVIFVFFITLMLAAYVMLTRERITAFFRSLVRPGGRAGFDALLHRADEGLSGVVRGQLVICGINGVLSAIGFALVGLKYWPVMAMMAAVFSLVPIFGSIASAVPAVGIGLTQGLGTATFVLLWIVGIHQLEANLLNPKIMGDAAKIHPVLIIFSLLVGEHFFQVIGAVLAVPTMSVAQSLFLHLRAVCIDAAPGELGDTNVTGKRAA